MSIRDVKLYIHGDKITVVSGNKDFIRNYRRHQKEAKGKDIAEHLIEQKEKHDAISS